MLLLPQLVQFWLPDDSASRQSPLSKQAPRSQIPPLISFLEGLPDVFTPDQFKGKRLLCGHDVSLCSVLSLLNLFGDAPWTPGSLTMNCAQPECMETLEFPELPNPQTLDGLEARLDLIQYSWNKDAPTEIDMNTVSVLRDILSRIGHSSRDPDPELGMKADVSENAPSEASLMQTLVNMEMEAFGLMALNQGKSAEIPLRGNQPYCRYREAIVPTPGQSLRYNMASPGQYCECVTPHKYEREPWLWALTPAETEIDPDSSNAEKPKKLKSVRFVTPVVTEVQYFEPWWCDEYRDSGRYYSTGPHRRSIDTSTMADDDWEIERIENPEGLAAQISGDLDGEGSDCGTNVDAEEIVDVMEAIEPLDDDILDERERANESWDDETNEDLRKLHESTEDWF